MSLERADGDDFNALARPLACEVGRTETHGLPFALCHVGHLNLEEDVLIVEPVQLQVSYACESESDNVGRVQFTAAIGNHEFEKRRLVLKLPRTLQREAQNLRIVESWPLTVDLGQSIGVLDPVQRLPSMTHAPGDSPARVLRNDA
jgi:hypothetical protein